MSVQSSESETSEGAILVGRISRGEIGRDAVVLAARGFLPLGQEELITVLTYLVQSDDEEIASAARQSLLDIPPRLVVSYARGGARTAGELDALSRAVTQLAVLESIVRNRAASDETIEALARTAPPQLQDVIVVNQERLLRRPEILDALESNPELTSDIRRRVGEVREEFFVKQKNRPTELPPVEEEPLSTEQQEELDRLLAEAAAVEDAGAAPADLPPGLDERSESVWMALSRLTIAQKVQRAFKGSLTERTILVRERNKLVAGAVARSPRLTDSEVEAYAALRNVEEEVLRLIGANRTFMSKYPIMLNLVRNPKAPIGVVLPLINRLNVKDLKSLGSDRNVSETVRSVARRLYIQRKK